MPTANISEVFHHLMRKVHAFLGMQIAADLLVLAAASTVAAALSADMGMGEITGITQFIRDVGFPVFVAGYVLIRLERTMLRLTEAIDSLLRAYQQAQARRSE